MNIHQFFAVFILTVFFSLNASSQERIDLCGSWTFKNTKDSTWHKATVPGVVHLDLLSNHLIGDPYHGNNEKKQQWIEQEDWEYHKFFVLKPKDLENEHFELVFEGLDTYAKIYLNNKEIAVTNNMFRTWRIEVKQHLVPGKNELLIVFNSPIQQNREQLKNRKYELPAANETVELKVSPYTRKAAYHFGWDWGPRFVTAGIWRPCYLEVWNELNIMDISYTTSVISDSIAQVNFKFEIASTNRQHVTLEIADQSKILELKPGLNIIKFPIQIKYFKEWSINGLGKQNFNPIKYSIRKKNRIFDRGEIQVAIRKFELIQAPDEIGTSFYFKVNDQPVFIKGANYIPQDLFLPRVDSARYERLILQAANANINMLRVWGGGIYENDYFYDLCDRYGILVWQDFMFANSMYPNDSLFLSNIQAEITDNIKRLRNHPCIALWCGNNEIEVAWNNWGWQQQYKYTKTQEQEIFANYQYIFHQLIPNTLDSLDPTRPYTPTSPLSNWGKPENFNHSSMHYWGVWHGNDPIEAFSTHVGRFMVEYGYQSYPSYKTLLKSVDSSDMNLNSAVMLNRQKSYVGNGLLNENIEKYAHSTTDFKEWINLSQLVQAYALCSAIKAHRFSTPHCMGTLFWQLNDCWPGPSWSVIDYYGKEKKAYQTVKNYYAPVIAKLNLEEDVLTVTLLSDQPEPVPCILKINAHSTKGLTANMINTAIEVKDQTPYEVFLYVPEELRLKKGKNRKLSHFSIEIIRHDNLLFETNYYPETGANVNFPR